MTARRAGRAQRAPGRAGVQAPGPWALLAGIPLTGLFLITQRWLVSGLRSGALKG